MLFFFKLDHVEMLAIWQVCTVTWNGYCDIQAGANWLPNLECHLLLRKMSHFSFIRFDIFCVAGAFWLWHSNCSCRKSNTFLKYIGITALVCVNSLWWMIKNILPGRSSAFLLASTKTIIFARCSHYLILPSDKLVFFLVVITNIIDLNKNTDRKKWNKLVLH